MNDTPTIGLIGLGLVGRGIATCLLAHGFRVAAYDRVARQHKPFVSHIDAALGELVRRRMAPRSRIRDWDARLRILSSLRPMGECPFVVESIGEDLASKRETFERLEESLSPEAVIASNTSSIPITLLQQGRKHPQRFIGMHWAEPAEVTRYLEIIPGKETSRETVERTRRLGEQCGKEPAVLNFDIRGFISNRMMYAMLREACHLVESGVADIEAIDRSFRNDIGWWATLAGPFRWMDLTGIPGYAAVMEGLFPELSNAATVPSCMRKAVASGARGVSNGKGFYKYTRAGARRWEQAWVDFTYDIRKLVDKYERRIKL